MLDLKCSEQTAAAVKELYPHFKHLVYNYPDDAKKKEVRDKFKEDYGCTSPHDFLQQNCKKLGEYDVLCL